MLKLLFSTAITAPVMLLAFATGGGTSLPALNGESVASTATPADCRSETVGVSFHTAATGETYLESHSAERLGHLFTDVPGCETDFVRLTALVPEASTGSDMLDVTARRTELALHIQALIGEDAAKTLTVTSDIRSSAAGTRLRSHALVRLERKPVTDKTPEKLAALPANKGASAGGTLSR